MTAWVVSPERRASFSSSALSVDVNFMLVAAVAMDRLPKVVALYYSRAASVRMRLTRLPSAAHAVLPARSTSLSGGGKHGNTSGTTTRRADLRATRGHSEAV